MSKESGISRTSLIIYALAVLIAAFVGILLGNWYINSHQAEAFERQIGKHPYSTALLGSGDAFPSIELIDPDGMPVNTISLIEGHKSLIVMLSPGCEPYALIIDDWKENIDRIPSDLKVITDPRRAFRYWDKIGAPFPLYCDTAHKLSSVYGLEAYPTVIGIDDVGQIAFMVEGWREHFSFGDAYKLITMKK